MDPDFRRGGTALRVSVDSSDSPLPLGGHHSLGVPCGQSRGTPQSFANRWIKLEVSQRLPPRACTWA